MTMKKNKHVNWHSATVDAIKIDLRDYADILEYHDEYPLSRGSHRIDLLLIKKKPGAHIPKAMCTQFQEFNLFEIKGIHSSLSTDSYYKTNAYAGLWIDETGTANQYTRKDLTLNFIIRRFPRSLFRHLQKDCGKMVEKTAPGIYYVYEEMYVTQFLVTSELDPAEYLYLKCLTDDLADMNLITKLASDCKHHFSEPCYSNYMNQLSYATVKKGANPMVCEGLLNLYGTSSEEIIAKTKKEEAEYYQPQIKRLQEQIAQLQAENERLRNK